MSGKLTSAFDIDNEEDIISPTFCPIPWFQEYIESDGSDGLCYNGPGYSRGVFEWNSPAKKQLRLDMLAGRKNKACLTCHNEESNGKNLSLRQQVLSYHRIRLGNNMHKLKEFVENVTDNEGGISVSATGLHITLGNLCNGQCRMCSPWNSTSLIPVHKHINNELGFNTHPVKDFQWVNDDALWEKKFYPKINNVKWLNLMGGEPFIIKRVYKILKYCVDNNLANDMEIYFNTNCAQPVPEKVLDLWPHFKNIHLDLSIDDIEGRVEWIRYPIKWEQYLSFIDWCENDSPDNVTVEMLPSIGNYNIFYFPDMLDWLAKQNYKKVNKNLGGLPNINLVYYPDNVGIKTLPGRAKQIILDKYQSWYSSVSKRYVCESNLEQVRNNFKWCLKRIMNLPKHIAQDDLLYSSSTIEKQYQVFKDWNNSLDKMRGTNFYNTFPIFKEFDK